MTARLDTNYWKTHDIITFPNEQSKSFSVAEKRATLAAKRYELFSFSSYDRVVSSEAGEREESRKKK